MLALCSPMLAVCGPRSALCWPYVGLSWPYVGPMLALSWPYVAPSCRQILPNYVKTPSTCHFFRSGAPPERQNHVKRVVFLIAPRWNSGTPRGTKHRKTRCFWTPRAKNTVNYVGFCEPEVTRTRSAAGAASHYNLRLPIEGLRPGHGPAALGPAPGFKGLRPTAGRRPKGPYVRLG